MATTKLTLGDDAIVTEIQIAAPPDRVFQALIDPKEVMSWWTGEQCAIEAFALEPKVGGRWRYDSKSSRLTVNGVSKFHCEGEVLEYEPPRLLSYTWIANWHDDKARHTVVRWELAAVAGGTRLKVTHSGLAQEPTARRDYGGGWPGVAAQLKTFVERQSMAGRTEATADSMRITPDGDAIVSEIHIAAPPDRVFYALVNPEQVLRWWGQSGIYRCTEFKADLRVGGKWRGAGVGPGGDNFEVTGEYLEIDSPRLLVHTWVASWTGTAKTTVRWELEPREQGTLVTLRHTGLSAYPGLAQSYRGWPRMLGWLQALLERGETVDMR